MAQAKMVYEVVILRQDGNHLSIIQSTDYDKCYEKWKALQTEWTNSVKEQKPFILEDPVVTAFSPSMIYEIKLIPIMAEDLAQSSTKNPYAQKMNQNGFGQTFPGASGIDLLTR